MTNFPGDAPPGAEGVRPRKRRETRRRIAEAGLRLFLADGYDATTLDAIAAAAGISRRTFFAYFRAKDEILAEWQAGAWEAICAEVAAADPGRSPIDAVRDAFARHVDGYGTDEMLRIDRLFRSCEALQTRKHAHHAAQEQELAEALGRVWPEPSRRQSLRLVAMMSIGAMRLAIDLWAREGGPRPVAGYLADAFARLKDELR